MGIYEQDYRRRISLRQGMGSLMMLIAVNLAVFVIFAFIKAIYYFSAGENGNLLFQQNILKWFVLPADLHDLVRRPWTIITHMFIHEGVWHILGNMLWLWAFGQILEDLTGNRKVIPVFLYGGLAGALGFVLAYNLLPGLQQLPALPTALGASAGVMAIAVATTTIAPGYRLFPMIMGGFPLWILTVIFVIIDLATIPSGSNTGGHIAHLSGAAMGYFFIFLVRRGIDLSDGINRFFDWIGNLFNPDRPRRGRNMKTELFYRSKAKPFKKTPNLTQQKVDEILDKINQKGYHFLSDEEKELLKRASEEDL